MQEPASYIDPASNTNASAQRGAQAAPAAVVPAGRIRVRGLAVAAGAWAAIAAAACLVPDPSGCGTHEQLGLPPCSFLARTGWPCPSCGLTTSVAATSRGRVVFGFKAHPFGVMVVAGLAVLGLAGAVEAVGGRDTIRLLRPGMLWAWAAIIGLPVGWIVKIIIGVADGSLPMR